MKNYLKERPQYISPSVSENLTNECCRKKNKLKGLHHSGTTNDDQIFLRMSFAQKVNAKTL